MDSSAASLAGTVAALGCQVETEAASDLTPAQHFGSGPKPATDTQPAPQFAPVEPRPGMAPDGSSMCSADEALRRWAKAEANDTEHSYWGMRPLENDAAHEALAIVTMLVCFSWVYVGPWLLVYLLVRSIVYHSSAAMLLLATFAAAAVLPASPDFNGWGRRTVWQSWRRYFRMRWVTPKNPFLTTERHYMFLHFPHASFPMGSWLSMALTGNECATGLPERTAGCVASVLLHIPGLRHMFTWMGCTPAGRDNIMNLLRHRSVGIIPEGVAGVFRGANRHREQAYFSPRKGVCRIALLTGTDIVPVYIFGQSQVFTYIGTEKLSRRVKAAVGIFWGRWGLPLPHKTDLVMAIGHPIPVKQTANPSQVEIEGLHTRIEEAVQQLYDRHHSLLPELDGKELRFV